MIRALKIFLVVSFIGLQCCWAQPDVSQTPDNNAPAADNNQPPADNTVPVISDNATKSNMLDTLELKDMDINDVLKLLSAKTGLNIIAGKTINGRVTIFLQNVKQYVRSFLY